ncbi:MAG TPA: hypothetical protein VMV65_07020 [Alphaproteobacteria bacterium]|nr:hypothetical protein [Alphaproteobacteria bacterium]
MLSLRNLFAGFGLGLCVLAFAACGGGGSSVTYPPVGPTCSPGTSVQMIYPIPGATAVPDSPQQFVFVVASPLPNNWNVYFNTQNTFSNSSGYYTNAGMQTITAGQVPSPSATPAIANPYYQSVTLAASLASGTTWYVWLNNATASNNCAPLGPLGSFTTL